MMRSCFVLTVLLLTGGVVGQTPAVNSLTPWAVAPGQTTEVVLRGASLDAPTDLWTNLPVEATVTAGASDRATCRVTLPANAPVGIAAMRVATRGGVSNLQLFMVDDLPTVAAGGDNHSPGAAREVAAPAAVEGACGPLRTDYYRIRGRRGRRVSLEVVAARLGSALDPVLRLLDASGRELAWSDDSPGAGGDCRFEHVFAADGEYLVEVRDVNYDGGPGHRYRLRVGDFPLAVVPYPLGGRRGTAAMVALLGEGCEGAGPVLAGVAKDARGAAVSARRAAGGGSGFAALVAGDLDETVEAEPNDSREAATPLGFPVAVSGRMESAGDVDWYRLALRKGRRVSFRGRSRSLGSPCDLVMQLVREGGGRVAESRRMSRRCGATPGGGDRDRPEGATTTYR